MESSGKVDAHTANLAYHQAMSRESNERVAALNRRWGHRQLSFVVCL